MEVNDNSSQKTDATTGCVSSRHSPSGCENGSLSTTNESGSTVSALEELTEDDLEQYSTGANLPLHSPAAPVLGSVTSNEPINDIMQTYSSGDDQSSPAAYQDNTANPHCLSPLHSLASPNSSSASTLTITQTDVRDSHNEVFTGAVETKAKRRTRNECKPLCVNKAELNTFNDMPATLDEHEKDKSLKGLISGSSQSNIRLEKWNNLWYRIKVDKYGEEIRELLLPKDRQSVGRKVCWEDI